MSKQEIMEVIVGCVDKLEQVPSFSEVIKMTQISRRQIRKHFGSYRARCGSAIWKEKRPAEADKGCRWKNCSRTGPVWCRG